MDMNLALCDHVQMTTKRTKMKHC